MLARELLVTGAGGFAGGHAVRRALLSGHRVVALLHGPSEGNGGRAEACAAQRRRLAANSPRGAALRVVEGSLLDRSFVADLLEREEVEAVLHLAGRTNIRAAELDRDGTRRANVDATQVLAEEADRLARRRGRPITFVFASTVKVFAGLAQEPARPAGSARPEPSRAPTGTYAATKLEAEVAVGRAGSLDVAIVYAPNLLGPGGEGTVIPTWIERALSGEHIEIWGDRSGALEFLPVGSFADELLGLLEDTPIAGRVRRRTLAGPIRVTLEQLAREVCASLARLAPLDDLGELVRRDYSRLVTVVP